MTQDELRARLQTLKDAEQAAGHEMFLGAPDRWYERPRWRCKNDHVSVMYLKAEEKGESWMADRVYSGVPSSLVGRRQHIEIGPVSGLANVKHWLRVHGRDPGDEALCRRILHAAKNTDHTLSKEELEAICRGA